MGPFARGGIKGAGIGLTTGGPYERQPVRLAKPKAIQTKYGGFNTARAKRTGVMGSSSL